MSSVGYTLGYLGAGPFLRSRPYYDFRGERLPENLEYVLESFLERHFHDYGQSARGYTITGASRLCFYGVLLARWITLPSPNGPEPLVLVPVYDETWNSWRFNTAAQRVRSVLRAYRLLVCGSCEDCKGDAELAVECALRTFDADGARRAPLRTSTARFNPWADVANQRLLRPSYGHISGIPVTDVSAAPGGA